MKTIDIVLATYNGEKYLHAQLDSLLAQTRRADRILVFDDGSTDRTVDIINEYAKDHPEIILYINNKNLGYTRNFLRGLKKTSADYVMLCDQDDVWKEEKIEKTLDKMKKTEDGEPDTPVLVYTDAELYYGRNVKNRSFLHSSHFNTKKIDMNHLLMENKCMGCTVMINRALVGFLDRIPKGIRFHDWWLALIAAGFGRIGFLDETTLLYRQHEGNQVGGLDHTDFLKDRFSNIGAQRDSIRQIYRQGAVFYRVYGDRLTGDQKQIAHVFSTMQGASFFARRVRMIRYGFTKSGAIRNIGLFLIM